MSRPLQVGDLVRWREGVEDNAGYAGGQTYAAGPRKGQPKLDHYDAALVPAVAHHMPARIRAIDAVGSALLDIQGPQRDTPCNINSLELVEE